MTLVYFIFLSPIANLESFSEGKLKINTSNSIHLSALTFGIFLSILKTQLGFLSVQGFGLFLTKNSKTS